MVRESDIVVGVYIVGPTKEDVVRESDIVVGEKIVGPKPAAFPDEKFPSLPIYGDSFGWLKNNPAAIRADPPELDG